MAQLALQCGLFFTNAADMTFHGYFRSSAAYRCRIAFNLKGVDPARAYVHLRKGEQRGADFLALNPQGLVPVLEVGGRLLAQSLAIIEWLEETHPEPPLLPREPLDRAEVRALALAIACDIHPLQNLRVLTFLSDELALDGAALDTWRKRWIAGGLRTVEAQLSATGSAGTFCFGDEPTLADCCLIPQLFSAERFGIDLSDLTILRRIAASAAAHPAFVAAHPSRQPDADA
jgi:maleylacetoacetate isomerase